MGGLEEFLGLTPTQALKASHKKWVETCLETGDNYRDDKWTQSIAVGNKAFIEKVKSRIGGLAVGRKRIDAGKTYQLREGQISYNVHFGGKKSEIGPNNSYVWD